VRIGAISARSEGLIPSFTLQDVVLLDPQGREALQAAAGGGGAVAALAVEPRFRAALYRPAALDIRRAADGRIFVGGLDFSRGSDNEGRAADWFFSQGEFVIQGGTLPGPTNCAARRRWR
jgi:hypothetical protein